MKEHSNQCLNSFFAYERSYVSATRDLQVEVHSILGDFSLWHLEKSDRW